MQVVYEGRRSPSVNVAVTNAQPGFFTQAASGAGIAAVLNEDSSLNSGSNPAARGSVVSFFVTGEGQTDPSGTDGLLAAAPLPAPLLPISVRIGGKPAEVRYAGGAPGLVAGVMQVNARVPADLLAGAQSVYLVVGNTISPQGVTVSIR
jgi:uncharacterized protein (TIGR03437 family)